MPEIERGRTTTLLVNVPMVDEAANPLRVDLHSHTHYSPDAWTSPGELVRRAKLAGLDRIAVTDHGEIEGALEAASIAPDLVIVGEEIRCDCGTELIGLFLTRKIPPGLPIREVADRIRDQGGVVYAPHPSAYLFRSSWHAERALAVADLVEGFNSRAFLRIWNRTAARAAEEWGLPVGAGSDAHFPWEIGRAHTELPWFDGAAEFRGVINNARAVGFRTANPLIHAGSLGLWGLRKFARINNPRLRREASGPGTVTHVEQGSL